MGLSRLDFDSYKLIPDEVLTWPVPEDWSLEDAVTVPHAFCGVRSIFVLSMFEKVFLFSFYFYCLHHVTINCFDYFIIFSRNICIPAFLRLIGP